MFLEVAIFDPTSVAATGRKLGLQSDARYRFERGLDQTSPFWGAEVATRLVQEICGGEASELVVAGSEPDWRRPIPLRHSRIAGLCGVEVPEAEARRLLGDRKSTRLNSSHYTDSRMPSTAGKNKQTTITR